MLSKVIGAIKLTQTVLLHPSNGGSLVAGALAVGRLYWWQSKSRGGQDIVFDWIEGTKLVAHRGMSGATSNIYNGLDEFADMSFLLHFLEPDDLFFDIGANIGSYSVLASGACKARSVSFEPDTGTMASFQRNTAENAMADRVTPVQLALAEAPGTLRFTVGLVTMNHITDQIGANTQEVEASTLDLMSAQHGVPDLIKMDIEGGEPSALRGGAETLANPKLKAVIIEDKSPPVCALLEAAGLTRRWYDAAARKLSKTPTPGSFNTIFIRDPAEIERKLARAPARRFRGLRF